MTLSDWTRFSIVSVIAGLAGCQAEMVMIEEDYPTPLAADGDQKCVLDISVDADGRTLWKGEAISDAEFDRRLKAGLIDEACIEPKKTSPESR